MAIVNFEWDKDKNSQNIQKHHMAFETAQYAFADPHRIIAVDIKHSGIENRYYCFGVVEHGILTVRFTYRNATIRIIGAGY